MCYSAEYMCDLCGSIEGFVYEGYLKDVDVYVSVCAKCVDSKKYGVSVKRWNNEKGFDWWD